MVAGFFILLAAASLLAYSFGLAEFADQFPALGEPGVVKEHLFLLVGATLLASILHVIGSVAVRRRAPRVTVVIGVAMAARLILLFGGPQPILEGDPARVRFDGRLVNLGFSPYEFAPQQLVGDDVPPAASDGPSLRRFRLAQSQLTKSPQASMPRPEKLRRPDLRTSATPLSLWIASVADRFKPGSTRGYAFCVLVADALAMFFIVLALNALGLPAGWLLVYAWSPVLLRECYVTLSVDAFVLPGLAMLVYGLVRGRRLATGVAIALAASIRPAMLLLWPANWRRVGILGGLLAVILLALPLLPFLHHEVPAEAYAEGTVHVWRNYEYNSFAENILRGVLRNIPRRAETTHEIAGVTIVEAGAPLYVLLSKIFSGVLLLGVVTYVATRRVSRDPDQRGPEGLRALGDLFFVLVAMLACSPVLQPAHTLWLLPILAVRPFGLTWLALPGVISLSYLTHLAGPFEADLWIGNGKFSFRIVEFGILGMLLLLDLLWFRVLFSARDEGEVVSIQAPAPMDDFEYAPPTPEYSGAARSDPF